MTPGDSPPSLELIVYQLKDFKETQERDRKHVDARLDQIQSDVRAMAYVHKDSYEKDRTTDARLAAADKKTAEDYAGETRKIAEDARRVAWATAIFLVGALGAILAVIKAVAG